MLLAMTVAALMVQEIGTISPGGVEAIGPKQDDPLAICEPGETTTTGLLDAGRVRTSSSSGGQVPDGEMGMLSQGRVRLSTSTGVKPGSENDPKAAAGVGLLAIGPKQDDPRSPNMLARPGDDDGRGSLGR